MFICVQAGATLGAEGGGTAGEEGKEVILTGLNDCQACGEVKSSEPGAKCSPFGHICIFSVEKATDVEGKEIEELKKKGLNYKLNQQGLPLVKSEEYRGARLEIKGKWFKEKGSIEVSSFKRLEK
ncbi:MAG: hypothetical protein ACK4WF_02800 [Candidatus Brocadiales bacterium]